MHVQRVHREHHWPGDPDKLTLHNATAYMNHLADKVLNKGHAMVSSSNSGLASVGTHSKLMFVLTFHALQRYNTAQVIHAALQFRFRGTANNPAGKAPDLLEHSMYASARTALFKATTRKERWVAFMCVGVINACEASAV